MMAWRAKADSVKESLAEVEAKLKDERDFWDEVVRFQISEESRPEQAGRMVELADALLEKRRERFPL